MQCLRHCIIYLMQAALRRLIISYSCIAALMDTSSGNISLFGEVVKQIMYVNVYNL